MAPVGAPPCIRESHWQVDWGGGGGPFRGLFLFLFTRGASLGVLHRGCFIGDGPLGTGHSGRAIRDGSFGTAH